MDCRYTRSTLVSQRQSVGLLDQVVGDVNGGILTVYQNHGWSHTEAARCGQTWLGQSLTLGVGLFTRKAMDFEANRQHVINAITICSDLAPLPITSDYGGPSVSYADGVYDTPLNRFIAVREE